VGPVAGLAHAPLAGQVPMIPLPGPSHMVPAGGPAHVGPVAGSAHMGLSAEFGHAVSVRDWGTHAPLTAMNGVEHHQVYGDHPSQEHPTG
jgi:hypothetical protein